MKSALKVCRMKSRYLNANLIRKWITLMLKPQLTMHFSVNLENSKLRMGYFRPDSTKLENSLLSKSVRLTDMR